MDEYFDIEDYGYETEEDDPSEEKARNKLIDLFNKNRRGVFYSRQLEVMFENEFFHWVTNRALRELLREGLLNSSTNQLTHGTNINICWHKGNRYYKRAANNLIEIIEAARMLPKTWIEELRRKGGFSLILKYQLYPWAYEEVAKRVREEIGLPVDTPRALEEGTMNRFENWHNKNL